MSQIRHRSPKRQNYSNQPKQRLTSPASQHRFPNQTSRSDEINQLQTQKRPSSRGQKVNYFRPEGQSLPDQHQRYCRCLLHVSAQQSFQCLQQQRQRLGQTLSDCVNPYAVCTRSVGRTGKQYRCTRYYDLETIPPAELNSWLAFKGKTLKQLQNEQQSTTKSDIARSTN